MSRCPLSRKSYIRNGPYCYRNVSAGKYCQPGTILCAKSANNDHDTDDQLCHHQYSLWQLVEQVHLFLVSDHDYVPA